MKKIFIRDAIKPLIPVTLVCLLYMPCKAWSDVTLQYGPPSLKTVQLPDIPNLDEYVKDKESAVQLGKALFWDMQVGSDGTQACASCHFHAGVDNRTKNQINPGIRGEDTTFGNNPATGKIDYPQFRPNYTAQPEDFPLHKLADPDDRHSSVIADTNDLFGSQGVFPNKFFGIIPFWNRDIGIPSREQVFTVTGKAIRQVTPRNTPSMINAAFNFDNFWDGRAKNIFNGVSPFGVGDQNAKIYVNNNGTFSPTSVRLKNASLCSQAVGPPLSTVEMSFVSRDFPKLGKKVLLLRPLAKQMVHPEDSVLGTISKAWINFRGKLAGLPGLDATYPDLIKKAFHDKYWNSDQIVRIESESEEIQQANPRQKLRNRAAENAFTRTLSPIRATMRTQRGDEFSQMEMNFSLFFGIALMMYERTLIADDTLYDRYQENPDNFSLNEKQLLGKEIFLGKGKCGRCHQGPEFTDASVRNSAPDNEIKRAPMPADGDSFLDNGFHNIAARPTAEDIGRGGFDPFGYPLSYSRLAFVKNCNENPPPGLTKAIPPLEGDMEEYIPNLPPPACDPQRVAVDGAFKTPGLRNVELTGPYLHNGGAATLRQVVDFYNRGGDFHEDNLDNLSPNIEELGLSEEEKDALVAFLLTLTDDRVMYEKAPFDHPQLFVPHGEIGNEYFVVGNRHFLKYLGFSMCDKVIEIPATGKDGRITPLKPFMDLDPYQP